MKIIFVCHGNICRSPMAEFVMKDYIAKDGTSLDISVSSAATSDEELGNPVHRGTVRKLSEHGISCNGKRAAVLSRKDMEDSDIIAVMDNYNLRNVERLAAAYGEKFRAEVMAKTHLLLGFTENCREVADPWYTGNFDETWEDITEGCRGLLRHIKEKYSVCKGKI